MGLLERCFQFVACVKQGKIYILETIQAQQIFPINMQSGALKNLLTKYIVSSYTYAMEL